LRTASLASQFEQAGNLTDVIAALATLANLDFDPRERENALAARSGLSRNSRRDAAAFGRIVRREREGRVNVGLPA
jgi:hypothetical protein